MKKTDEQWRKTLTDEQYAILRKKGTEAPFSGELLKNNETGAYTCAACGATLFMSDHKFDSGTGWPSFYDVASSDAVDLHDDSSLGMQRTEVTCKNCGGHLGHLFYDAFDQPNNARYCINSAALKFNKAGESKPQAKAS